MRRLLFAIAVVTGTPAWAQSPTDFTAVDAALDACSARRPDNDGASNCMMIAKDAADRRLNALYDAALKAVRQPAPDHAPFDPEVPKRLIAAERAWIAFRDAECSYQSTIARGGSGEGYAYAACLYAQTRARVVALASPEAPHNVR